MLKSLKLLSLEELFQRYNLIDKDDVILRASVSFIIFQKIKKDTKHKDLTHKVFSIIKHFDFIDEYFTLTDFILSDFMQKFLQQEQNPYQDKSLSLDQKFLKTDQVSKNSPLN